jgi:outer membrane receptor protein involved in Fe transport
LQWLGAQRIPDTSLNLPEYQLPQNSPDYFLMNAQITKDFGEKWSVYVGVENILDYKLEDPIVASNDPFGLNTTENNFDASMVWGPIFGRMAYAGFRFRIK